MTDSQISTFPVPDLDDIPEDLRSMMMGIQEKTGFIPNVFFVYKYFRLIFYNCFFPIFFDYRPGVRVFCYHE